MERRDKKVTGPPDCVQNPQQMADLVRASIEGIAVLDTQGVVVFANPAAEAMLGKQSGGAIGYQFGYPSADGKPSEIILRPGKSDMAIVEMRAAETSWEGKPAFVINLHDITLKRKSFDQVQLLATIVQSTDEAVVSKTLGGVITSWNPGAEKMYGYSAEEATGQNISIIVPDDIENDFSEVLEKIGKGERVEAYETVRCTKNGKRIYVSLTVSPIHDETGCIIGGAAISRDITERRLFAEKMRRSEELLNETGDMAKVWGWELDLASEKVLYTRTTKTIHEVPDDYNPSLAEAIDFFAPEARPKLTEAIRRAREEGIPFDMDLPFITAKGRRLWTRAIGNPVFDDGKCVRLHGMFQDITDLKAALDERIAMEDQFNQVQRLESIGQLAGGVAHDFNNMLSVIIGYGNELLANLRKEDPMRELVEEIVNAGKRSAELTRQLLAFSRKQVQRLEVLNVNDIVRNLEKMLRRIIGEDIELSTRLAEGLNCVEVDPGQIEQVILNLAVNARDAMPQGGKFTVETANIELDEHYARHCAGVLPGKYVELILTDNGCGMDEATQEKLFEPFFTTKVKGKGTGLGLSTVYGIVKQSKGNIWAYSEPGQGTTFKIYFPHTSAEPIRNKGKEGVVKIKGGGEGILVIDDEPALRELCQRMLENSNYKVTVAASGGDALRLVEGNMLRPDLILTDVVMPEMSGKDLVEGLKKMLPDLKVLFMSGYTDDAIVHHGILDPETPFIQKPFGMNDLERKVREILDGS
jgi:two-component system, cell cycle sensor histidine kinase and response regulator CckA